jgi:cell division protein ZipA
MSELRWILIGFGIVLLAGIYLWGRRGATAVGEEVALRSRPEPAMPPHGFTEVRRETAYQRDDIPDYDESPYDDSDGPEQSADEVDPPIEDYDDTAVRPVRPASPRGEARVPRGASPAVNLETARPLPDFRRGRVEPTLGNDSITEELPVQAPNSTAVVTPAPTLSSSDQPAARRSPDRRKILSLRLSSAPQKIEGAKLQEVLAAELLTHGKYDIFHREHSDGQAIFSIASMVEPGTFDLEKMGEALYPGVTMFAQLPGPVPGMHALNELVACARRLHQTLGGVLQDDRGVPLTVHRIERMKQEVRDFERPQSGRGSQE